MSALTSVSGFPRIGQNRELKKIIEAYWKGNATLDEVRATAKELRAKHWKLQQAAGIDLIPSNDFSYYDQMLDTAILLNVIPQRYQRLAFENPEETLFAMGRGYQGEKGDVTALPMKKWFTTNYHYLVPEIDSATDIKLNSTKPFDEFNEAKALGIATKPVLIGPYTFLKLARNPQAEELDYDKGLVNAVAAVYAEVVAKFAELGAQWIQIDEPYLVLDKEPGDVELFKSLYADVYKRQPRHLLHRGSEAADQRCEDGQSEGPHPRQARLRIRRRHHRCRRGQVPCRCGADFRL